MSIVVVCYTRRKPYPIGIGWKVGGDFYIIEAKGNGCKQALNGPVEQYADSVWIFEVFQMQSI